MTLYSSRIEVTVDLRAGRLYQITTSILCRIIVGLLESMSRVASGRRTQVKKNYRLYITESLRDLDHYLREPFNFDTFNNQFFS